MLLKSRRSGSVLLGVGNVCGYSPCLRLDHGEHPDELARTGASRCRRMRSSARIHIDDMVAACAPDVEDAKISGRIFNAGYENQGGEQIAEMVRSVVG